MLLNPEPARGCLPPAAPPPSALARAPRGHSCFAYYCTWTPLWCLKNIYRSCTGFSCRIANRQKGFYEPCGEDPRVLLAEDFAVERGNTF